MLKIMTSAASSARSKSASSNTMKGLLPPSSMLYFFSPALRTIALPVAVEPVKDTSRTSGCATSGAPASRPLPCTMLSTPGGTPASSASWPRRAAVIGLSSLGLSTAVLPKARQGATLALAVSSGTFHGATSAQTPTGCSSV